MPTQTQTNVQPPAPIVAPVPASPPSWFLNFASLFLKLGQINFSNFFWVLFIAAALFLGSQLSKSRTQVGAAKLPTPSSQEFKNLQLAQSIAVVLNKPLTMANGDRVTVTDAKTRLQASVKVKDWQDRELIKQQAGITMLAMLRGTTTPRHPCYQRDRGFCLDMLRRQNDESRVEAVKRQDLLAIMQAGQFEEALNMLAQGNPEQADFNPDLYTVAIATQRSAIADLNQLSDNGQAKAMIEQLTQEEPTDAPNNARTGSRPARKRDR